MKLLNTLLTAAGLALACLCGSAFADNWPPAQVKIVVPYPPGTEPDLLARDVSAYLGKQTGKSFIVDNRPGANAIIGTGVVAKADGDGSTLLMVDRLSLVTNPMLYSKMPYDWEQSLKPVTDIGSVQLYVAVRQNLDVSTFKEFIAKAKAAPGKINVGTGGSGHVTHLGMAMLARSEGAKFTYVPYKGVGPAMTALLGGEVDAVMAGGLVVVQQYRADKVKVLTMGGDARSSFMPKVPTLAETGGKAGNIPSTVFSLFAPGKTPDDVVNQIRVAVDKVIANPQLRKSYQERGLEARTSTPVEMMASMRADAVRYEKIIQENGIKLE